MKLSASSRKSGFSNSCGLDVYALVNKRKKSCAICGILTYAHSLMIIELDLIQSLTSTCKGYTYIFCAASLKQFKT